MKKYQVERQRDKMARTQNHLEHQDEKDIQINCSDFSYCILFIFIIP